MFPTITYVTLKTTWGQLVGQPPKIPQPQHSRVVRYVATGPVTSYVGLYQENLVGKIDQHPPSLGQPWYSTRKTHDHHRLSPYYLGWGFPGQRGQNPFFPPNIGMEYRMKIEQNGRKLQKLGGHMTLTSHVGLYQEKPGMTNQPTLTQNHPGRPV